MLEKILIPVFACLIGVLIGSRLRLGWDAVLKRKRFRIYLRGLRRKIDTTQIEKLVQDHVLVILEIPKLEREVLEVGSFLSEKNASRIDAAFASYKTTRFADPGDKVKNEETKKKLIHLLREISHYAK